MLYPILSYPVPFVGKMKVGKHLMKEKNKGKGECGEGRRGGGRCHSKRNRPISEYYIPCPVSRVMDPVQEDRGQVWTRRMDETDCGVGGSGAGKRTSRLSLSFTTTTTSTRHRCPAQTPKISSSSTDTAGGRATLHILHFLPVRSIQVFISRPNIQY